MRAAGGAAFAVDEVMAARSTNAFVATRPPGHHAETATPMGFCFFNNAAIAARHAQAVHGAERVAIVDFDVHHGNGTQDIFWNDKSVLYASTHEMPLYPGTGARSERGEHDQIVNAPLSARRRRRSVPRSVRGGDPAARRSLRSRPHHHLRRLRRASPRSARPISTRARKISPGRRASSWRSPAGSCGGRVVSLLEGGYDLEGLARSVAAHVAALMESLSRVIASLR